jgi:hypothetical protein
VSGEMRGALTCGNCWGTLLLCVLERGSAVSVVDRGVDDDVGFTVDDKSGEVGGVGWGRDGVDVAVPCT